MAARHIDVRLFFARKKGSYLLVHMSDISDRISLIFGRTTYFKGQRSLKCMHAQIAVFLKSKLQVVLNCLSLYQTDLTGVIVTLEHTSVVNLNCRFLQYLHVSIHSYTFVHSLIFSGGPCCLTA
jgi:hypothetical protein